jgi:lysyl-tRNA synthetase class 2
VRRTGLMKNILEQRSKITREVRNFFFSKNYIEVETPVRLPRIIPEEHIDPLHSEDWLLQASPEICMKRLLARGYEKIFQICKTFRKGERGKHHIPEMTMLEWYHVKKDYFDMMKETEELIYFIADKLNIKSVLRNKNKISFEPPFERISVHEAVKKYTDYSFDEVLKNFDEILSFEIIPFLGFEKPVFLYNFPASEASLAKLCPDKEEFAQRFELFAGGIELCNCFTELTNSKEQKKRFRETLEKRKKSGKYLPELPEKFLDEMNFMPESSGNALGLDRLIMLFLEKENVDEILSFKPENL